MSTLLLSWSADCDLHFTQYRSLECVPKTKLYRNRNWGSHADWDCNPMAKAKGRVNTKYKKK